MRPSITPLTLPCTFFSSSFPSSSPAPMLRLLHSLLPLLPRLAHQTTSSNNLIRQFVCAHFVPSSSLCTTIPWTKVHHPRRHSLDSSIQTPPPTTRTSFMVVLPVRTVVGRTQVSLSSLAAQTFTTKEIVVTKTMLLILLRKLHHASFSWKHAPQVHAHPHC